MVVYLTTNLINGKKYVGKDARNQPWYLGSGKYIKKAVKKYGKENFVKEILQECSTLEELNSAEIEWLQKLNCKSDPTYYNATDTITPSSYGKKLTEEHKKKISEANKGKKLTKEHKELISSKHTGIKKGPMSEDTKEKIRKALTGKPKSAQSKQKMSRSHKGRNNSYLSKPIQQVDIETGEVLREYSKIVDVSKQGFNRWSVQNNISGKSKTSGGFIWRYVK